MISLSAWDAQGACFVDLAGDRHRLLAADLIELALEDRDAFSGQRLPQPIAAGAAPELLAVAEEAQAWRFMLSDGRGLKVPADAITAAIEPHLWQVPRRCWRRDEAGQLPVHAYAAVLTDDEALRRCLLQVARYGFARLRGAPERDGEIARLVARFGTIRETNYGRIYDVRVQPDAANLADTQVALEPHTDNPYRASPPELQILHSLVSADDGGDSVLVDGLAVAEHLRATQPEAFALLARLPIRFAWSDGSVRLAHVASAIALGPDGQIERLRHNSRSFDRILDDDASVRAAWRAARDRFAASIAQPDFAYGFRLDPGDMIIMDNRRLLHGRTAFQGSAGLRHLQGAYADIDGLLSTLFRLTDDLATRKLADLAVQFAGPAMGESYGERVSIRDHMLQTAELAVAHEQGASQVIAALLHDIGWAMDGPHEKASADLLAPLFGPAVSEPIRYHVAAKRFLVATECAYASSLSEESRRTLVEQGGPMDTQQSAAFASSPWFEAAVALRRLDDAGKDLRRPKSQYTDYAPILRRKAIRALLEQADPAKHMVGSDRSSRMSTIADERHSG
jgi:gamma-butyrobetaine dioxygenase